MSRPELTYPPDWTEEERDLYDRWMDGEEPSPVELRWLERQLQQGRRPELRGKYK